MLWSIIKIVVFIALVAGAAFAAGHLLEMDGGVVIQFGGQEFSLTPLKAVIVLLLLVLSIWLLLKLAALLIAVLKFINGDETAISRHFARNRQEKGYEALSEGLMALASGEGDVAMAKARKAEKYLRKPALTNLITAQAAEMKGDGRTAEDVYKRLLTNEKTRFVGVRGIMRQKLAQGDTDTALIINTIGLTPLEAIRAATSLAALNLRIEDVTGRLAPGLAADVLVVDGEPHRDIHDLRRGRLVLRTGRPILPTPLAPPPLRLPALPA